MVFLFFLKLAPWWLFSKTEGQIHWSKCHFGANFFLYEPRKGFRGVPLAFLKTDLSIFFHFRFSGSFKPSLGLFSSLKENNFNHPFLKIISTTNMTFLQNTAEIFSPFLQLRAPPVSPRAPMVRDRFGRPFATPTHLQWEVTPGSPGHCHGTSPKGSHHRKGSKAYYCHTSIHSAHNHYSKTTVTINTKSTNENTCLPWNAIDLAMGILFGDTQEIPFWWRFDLTCHPRESASALAVCVCSPGIQKSLFLWVWPLILMVTQIKTKTK